MILKPNYLEQEIDQNVMLKFSLVISLVYNKDTDIEALVPASVSHHCLVLCDRRTDGQTDGQNYDFQDRPRICSRGKNARRPRFVRRCRRTTSRWRLTERSRCDDWQRSTLAYYNSLHRSEDTSSLTSQTYTGFTNGRQPTQLEVK